MSESTARLIASIGHRHICVVPWHYLSLHLHCPIQINLTRYADSVNSASGVPSMTNVSASFGKNHYQPANQVRAAHAGMDHYG
jgi:hypothetical protein